MRIARFVLLLCVLLVGVWWAQRQNSSTPAPTTSSSQTSSNLVMRNQRILDLNGRVAYSGDIDLAPILERIKRGQHDPHANDGTVFGNREGRLPRQAKGYYHEYVVRTPNLSGVGPQRLILGANNEVWYTPDHYQSFIRVQP